MLDDRTVLFVDGPRMGELYVYADAPGILQMPINKAELLTAIRKSAGVFRDP